MNKNIYIYIYSYDNPDNPGVVKVFFILDLRFDFPNGITPAAVAVVSSYVTLLVTLSYLMRYEPRSLSTSEHLRVCVCVCGVS